MELAQSYEHCRHVAKTQAKNFYYSFLVLPPEKRAAMCALYAFMRYSDDVSDDATLSSSKRDLLPRWRAALDRAFEGDYGGSPILPAFHDTVCRYAIPKRFFHDLIDGVEMDLTTTRYETFADLYRYCYRVASVVGFVCIHVWGFQEDAGTRGHGDAGNNRQSKILGPGVGAYLPAEACGIAFQLTNILRDLKEDGERGRIYLPQEDLRRFGYTEEELLRGAMNNRFLELMRFEAARAREYYEQALPLIPLLDPAGRPTFVIMYRIYRGLLEEIEAQGFHVFEARARLSTARKVGIVAQAWLGSHLPGGERLLRV
jgi:phytoene synthase